MRESVSRGKRAGHGTAARKTVKRISGNGGVATSGRKGATGRRDYVTAEESGKEPLSEERRPAQGAMPLRGLAPAACLRRSVVSHESWKHPGTTGEAREWMERVKGIEPSSRAWEAFVLPLNYTRGTCILRNFQAAGQRDEAGTSAFSKKIHDCCQPWISAFDLPKKRFGKRPAMP